MAPTTTKAIDTAPRGSATSSAQGSLLLALSTFETCGTCGQPISMGTDRCICSPVSGSGRALSGWLAGATIAPSGRPPAHANLSARRAVALGYLTIATSGQRLSGSSPSTRLAQCLGSRLRALTGSSGSTLYRMTWVHAATPAGRWISRLRVSVVPTSDNGSSGWPTPTEGDGDSSGSRSLPGSKARPGLSLTDAALLAGWATPSARDYRTPNHKTYAERDGGAKGEQLQNQVAHLVPGASLNGSIAATDGGGLLNPEFSRWLLGVPATWQSCAPTGTRSLRSPRPR